MSAAQFAKQATGWAATVIARHGGVLHAVPDGWDVELPDSSWVAANGWRELCVVARALAAQ